MSNYSSPAEFKYNPFNFNPVQANGDLASSKNTYNFKPGEVKSTMDNSKFTQDYFDKSVMAPLLRQYDTAIAPRISDAAASGGNTFSTRTQFARQNALQDLQTQATAQLASAARQDAIERSQQDLTAQQFNVGTATQNAQFGAGQQLSYDTMNKQAALNLAGLNTNAALQAGGMNQQAAQAAAALNSQNQLATNQLNAQDLLQAFGLNSQNALNFGTLNSNNALQAAQTNNQNRQFYNQLNTQTQMGLAESAANRQLQAAGLQQQSLNDQMTRMFQAGNLGMQLQSVDDQNRQIMLNNYMRQAPENNPWLKMMFNFIGQDPYPIAGGSGLQTTQGVMSNVGQIGQMAAMLFGGF